LEQDKKSLAAADIPGFNMLDLLQKIGAIKTGKKEGPKPGQAVFRKVDDRTTSQLEHAQFSGIRANELWNRFEIWILGHIATTVSYQEIFLNPQRLNMAYCEVFGLDHINMDAKTNRDLARLEERRRELKEPEIENVLSRIADPTMQEKADIKTIKRDEAKRSQ